MSERQDSDDERQDSLSSSDSHLCCCVCHCAVDYSDREAFFANDDNDSNDNNNGEKDQPLLLPSILYDEQNAMVLCDTCDRPFHQRCHFIPIITLPRGDWHCLICKTSATGGDKQSVYPFPPKSSESGGEILLSNPDAIHAWEYDSRHYKALAWKRELSRFKGVLSNQLQHIRLAEDTLRAHTSTKRAQQHVSLSSQILLQTILKLAGAKLRIRQWFQSLDKVLKSNGQEEWDILDEFLSEHPDQEIKWFPYGRDIERRIVPRLEQAGEVPKEVVTHAKNMPEDHDDDDLISLDELKCCICFRGDATDENDLILCDGVGCFRAYHMQCVSPAVQDVDEHEDWFCPLCTSMASLIADVQSAYTGDEWGGGDEEDTVHSWENAGDVFPEAPREMEMALRWKEGKHDDELVQFLSELLGMPVAEDKSNNNDDDDDSEEDSEDDDFDDQDESSQPSSQDSLQDLSSVEINIDRKELDALSLESKEENGGGRRTCRTSRATSAESSSMDDSNGPNVGALDESNIVKGKRRRKQVDYRKLNDSMFGDISDTEAARLFDDRDDEFKVSPAKRKRRRMSSSSTCSSDESESSSETSSEQPKKARRGRQKKKNESSDTLSNAKTTFEKPKKARRGRPKKKKESSDSSSNAESPSEEAKEVASRGTKASKKPAGKRVVRKRRPKEVSSTSSSDELVTNESLPEESSEQPMASREQRRPTKKKQSSEALSNAESPEGKTQNGRERKKQAAKKPTRDRRKTVNGFHRNGKSTIQRSTRNKCSNTPSKS